MESVVPVIDLKSFGDSKSYDKLREACEECGCFRLINHGIPQNLMSEMKIIARFLFDRPIEMKRRNVDIIAGSGYVEPSMKNPLYEAFGLYDFSSFSHQLELSSHQRDTIGNYVKAVQELAIDIGRKLGKSMGLEGDLFKGWPLQFRINKYHFTPKTLGLSGVQIHTDSGFLTILQDDETVGGLQVMNKITGEFQAVNPWPGTLLLNLGDVATAWSNGRFYNVKHRVECTEASTRISIASFVLGPKDEAIEAPSELVDEEHPRLYAPFLFEDFRKLRLSTMLRAGEALQLVRAPVLPNNE